MNFNKYKSIKQLKDVIIKKSNFFYNVKKLILKKKKSLGRSYGQIVCWHKGGGVKRNYRLLSKSNFNNSFGIVRSVEYDPNRTSYIGLIQSKEGFFYYKPVSSLVKINDIISFAEDNYFRLKQGDIIKLRYIPVGSLIFNIEKYPGSGPIYGRAAGSKAYLVYKDLEYGKVKLSSGEERIFNLNCTAYLGVPSNSNHKFNKKYKAGSVRLLNKRPTVRGTAMNPIDHPHGGGQGKSTPGRPSVSPWGKLTKGVPTKKNNKNFYKRII